MGDYISVKALGAVGDGVTDDSVAFRTALSQAAAGVGVVFVPPGVYMVSREPGTNQCLKITGNNVILFGVKGKSVIKQISNVASGTTSCCLLQISKARNVCIRDLELNGNWGNAQTTIAAASDGAVLPQSTINVADTTGFPSSGTFELILPTGAQIIAYTGKTPTAFTGCTGGTGTLRGDGDRGRIGYTVGYRSPVNTSITAPSNGHTLPQATIDVARTAAFPTAGQLFITSSAGDQLITYTGKTSSTFTGCSGGVGTIHTGDFVWNTTNGLNQLTQRDPKNHLVFCHGDNVSHGDDVDIEFRGVDFRQAYGDGLWIGGDGTSRGESGSIGGSRNIVVRDCTFDMCARNGISLIYLDRIRIEHCRFQNIITTAIDTEPEECQVENVVIEDCAMSLWWNPFNDLSKNVLSISGGAIARPGEWNYAQRYRITNCTIHGSVLISDAIDIRFANNSVFCDFDSMSDAPLYMLAYCDDVWIEDNYIYACSGGINDSNQGAIQIIKYQIDGVSAIQSAGVHVRGNRIHVRNGMDGIYLAVPGGGGGFSGTATSITGTALVQNGAGWVVNQFLGHQVVRDGVVATIASNTSNTLTLATWHNDGVHGWVDARGNPQNTPSAGSFVIQPTDGLVEVVDNTIDCVASDGRAAGRYGIQLNTTSTWGPYYNDARVAIERNVIRGGNPHGVHAFLYAAPPIKFFSIVDNFMFDDQPVPACTHGIFFDNHAGSFDPVAQVVKLIVRNNETADAIRNNTGGMTQGYWLESDGTQQHWVGYGSPANVISAPVGSTMFRKDGGTGSTFYVKEPGGLPLDGTHKTDRSGVTLSTGQTLTLDAVTTTANNCLVVQALTAVPGAGSSSWDQWANANLTGYAQILQETSTGAAGDFAAAAGVLPGAGSSGTGSVRQHAVSNEFGNGTYSFALRPQVPAIAPTWIANGTRTQGGTGAISPPWPTHQENDVAILLVQLMETDTGATISDPQWRELPGSPVLGTFSGSGVKMHLFGARAFKSTMPAPSVSHSGPRIMAEIMLFRGVDSGSTSGWVAK